MNTCLLNIPYHTRIIRRYSCTYYAPNFLFPPLELMYLGSIIKEWKKGDAVLIDAIAERINLNNIIKRIKEYQPNLLVFMAGLESFYEDIRIITTIKSYFASLKTACIGYLPSIFPRETLENNPAIDYVIMNEPEISFSEIYDEIKNGNLSEAPIKGVAKRYNGKIILGEERPRIKDLDILPFPDRSLIRQRLYNEFLLKKPFTVIQASRGCPFECTYCIRTYGREVAFRSVSNILSEIEEAILKYKIEVIRFTDDTFTLDRARVVELCDSILKRGFKFQWSALSRIDKIDRETLSLMKKAGCKRLYLGIESGSQRILDFYKKGYKADVTRDKLKMIKENNIEAVGFFMVGGIQTEAEFRQDISLAKKLRLDYVIVEKVTPYPGTPLFSYTKDTGLQERTSKWEKVFYREFYLRPKYLLNKYKDFIFNINGVLLAMSRLLGYLLFRQASDLSRREMI